MIVVNIVDRPYLYPSARERLFALQGCHFTPDVQRHAADLLEELTDDHSPEVEAMRAAIADAVEKTHGIRMREDEERRANESSVMSALRYRSVCRACGRG